MAGVAVAVLVYAAFMGFLMRAGLPGGLERVLTPLAAMLLLGASGALISLVLLILRQLPGFATGVIVGGAALLGFAWPTPLAGPAIGLTTSLIGATTASLLFGRFQEMAVSRKIATIGLLLISLATAIAIIVSLRRSGTEEGLREAVLSKQPPVAPIAAADPGQPGIYRVRTLTYGSGTDKRRPEYGAGASIKSRVVDGSAILKDKDGWQGNWRKWHWGFDTSRLPLNARVWMPEGEGPFPLVLVLHGNHQGQEYSEPGYAYLGELLASRGFILASLDENFLNGDWAGDYETQEHPARAWLLLEHLRLWREWTAAKDHSLRGKADMSRIALIGHSRGGEAIATAAEFNRMTCFPGDATVKFSYGFDIRSLIAIAPSDGQYQPAGMKRFVHDVNYFVIQGGHDADVSDFAGSRQYQRATMSEAFEGFKASLFIYRANHGQFNTVWGRDDSRPPGGWLLNLKPLLSGDEQRRIAKVYFSAFLEATLNGKREYVPLFEDYRRGAKWLPDATYAARFQDATYRATSNFDEDYDPGTTTVPGGLIHGEKLAVWREQRVGLRGGSRDDNGVYIGWRKGEKGAYEIRLPEGMTLRGQDALEFGLADAGETPPPKKGAKDEPKKETPKLDGPKSEPLRIVVELESRSGATVSLPLSRLGPVLAPLPVRFEKVNLPGPKRYAKDTEPVMQRYALPLEEFGKGVKGFDAAALRAIRFRLDPAQEGVVILDDIGFSRPRF